MGGSTRQRSRSTSTSCSRTPVLRVKDVPVFYLPVIYYPINKDGRATGFLMPKYGSSTVGGLQAQQRVLLGDQSQPGRDVLPRRSSRRPGRASARRVPVRRVAAARTASANFNVIDQKPMQRRRTAHRRTAGSRSYNVSGNVNQALPHRFRLARQRRTTSTTSTTQQLYQQDIMDISQRTRTIDATLSRRRSSACRSTATFEQNDIYSNSGIATASRGAATRRELHAATARRSRSARRADLLRRRPARSRTSMRQDDIERSDDRPQLAGASTARRTVRVPLSTLPFLTVTTTANWRLTEWMREPRSDNGEQRPGADLTRQLFDAVRRRSTGRCSRASSTGQTATRRRSSTSSSRTFDVQYWRRRSTGLRQGRPERRHRHDRRRHDDASRTA